jgi:CRISPR-associated endonuclease/helicase Cas3
VQSALVSVFTVALGFADLTAVQPRCIPSRAVQLQLSGMIVMADWIASDERYFPGISSLDQVNPQVARGRAAAAWAKLGLRGGWGALPVPPTEVFQDRFSRAPRPSQALTLDVVRRLGGPGLLVVEAPTGEGKTKAALAAAEILAARFGADGLFIGMPTQATSDPMFTNVREWVADIGADLAGQVALLHGKRMFNKEWRGLLEAARESSHDHHGGVLEDDPYGLDDTCAVGDGRAERQALAEWFLGRLRGLLSPFAVGTIDQLLFAATRTRHVMLRMAGLAGKVVVLDEVHAADVYMSQFLIEGLRWLGQARVPVVLLSATLPPAQRHALVAAYLAGAASQEEFNASDLPEPAGYPNVTAATMTGQGPEYIVDSAVSWREDLQVQVEILPEWPSRSSHAPTDVLPADVAVVDLLSDRLRDGGCALVIRNTVARAQATFAAVHARFGSDEVRLLHGRLHAGHRADRTEECLELLGPPSDTGPQRPHRLIVVATQIAEQSFDVDADLLITDLAPIDLLLQRLGRLHRHDSVSRPDRVAVPQLIVTGFAPRTEGAPSILPASQRIYGTYLLVRTAALVVAAAGAAWSTPGQVPSLVAQVYDEHQQVVPVEWADAEQAAFAEWRDKQRRRADSASPFLLTRFGEHENPTLEGLHYGGTRGGLNDEQFQALVRDGDPSVEVVLVVGDNRGFRTLGGRRLGINGEASEELLDEVLTATVRLPSKLTAVAERDLAPLDGWRGHPWLRYSRALVVDGQRCAALGEYTVRYDDDLGLVVADGPPQG